VTLLAFAAVALLVGSFIIWNTFSVLVAGRTRELALLRLLGATRRQVLGSVLAEATVVGLAAAAGVAAGWARPSGWRRCCAAWATPSRRPGWSWRPAPCWPGWRSGPW
jgi:predicted lysophospholipase L1 biosynthesis ABC-type transport system permease subunit